MKGGGGEVLHCACNSAIRSGVARSCAQRRVRLCLCIMRMMRVMGAEVRLVERLVVVAEEPVAREERGGGEERLVEQQAEEQVRRDAREGQRCREPAPAPAPAA